MFQATCPIVKKKAKNFASGLIVPGDLPDSEILESDFNIGFVKYMKVISAMSFRVDENF